MRDFRELKVWEKAHQLTLSVYDVTALFLKEELYGLTSQIRRAGASVAANIAEGSGKNSDAELGRFLQIALSSCSELEYHLLLARDLKMLPETRYVPMAAAAVEVKKMLTGFIQHLTAASAKA